MIENFKQTLFKNFDASIRMFQNVVHLCPDEIWQRDKKFFYLAYHTAIFLDYYLSRPVKTFNPLLSYTLTDPEALPEEAVDDVLPNRWYSRQEMLVWLADIRTKCAHTVLHASESELNYRWIQDEEMNMHGLCPSLVENYTLLDILFYNFRHVQHHVGQLNLLLRQKMDISPEWLE